MAEGSLVLFCTPEWSKGRLKETTRWLLRPGSNHQPSERKGGTGVGVVQILYTISRPGARGCWVERSERRVHQPRIGLTNYTQACVSVNG